MQITASAYMDDIEAPSSLLMVLNANLYMRKHMYTSKTGLGYTL